MEEHDFLMYVLQSHVPAVSLCESLARVSQIWDDLIDRDTDVPNAAINEAFWRCLVEIPSNRFYVEHRAQIEPLLRAFIVDWLDANDMERMGDDEKNVAYVIRDNIGTVVIHCAYLVGGYSWMRRVSVSVRKWVIQDEGLDAYKEKLAKRYTEANT